MVTHTDARNFVLLGDRTDEELGPVGLALKHAFQFGYTGPVTIDRIVVPSGFVSRAHRHAAPSVNIVIQGSATHYAGNDLEPTEVGTGDMFSVPAGEPHLVTSLTGCVAVEIRFGAECTEFLPDIQAIWDERYLQEWLRSCSETVIACPNRSRISNLYPPQTDDLMPV